MTAVYAEGERISVEAAGVPASVWPAAMPRYQYAFECFRVTSLEKSWALPFSRFGVWFVFLDFACLVTLMTLATICYNHVEASDVSRDQLKRYGKYQLAIGLCSIPWALLYTVFAFVIARNALALPHLLVRSLYIKEAENVTIQFNGRSSNTFLRVTNERFRALAAELNQERLALLESQTGSGLIMVYTDSWWCAFYRYPVYCMLLTWVIYILLAAFNIQYFVDGRHHNVS